MKNINHSLKLTQQINSPNSTTPQILSKFPSINPNEKDQDQRTPFFWACSSGKIDLVKHFLQQSDIIPNINVQDDEGWTPLIAAVSKGNQTVIQVLLNNKVDISLVNSNKSNALHYASSKGFEEILSKLLKYSIGPNCEYPGVAQERDLTGATPLIRAAIKGNLSCLKLLISYDCNVLAQDDQGNTALHHAVMEQNYQAAFLLIKAFKVQNNDGKIPADIATPKMRNAFEQHMKQLQEEDDDDDY